MDWLTILDHFEGLITTGISGLVGYLVYLIRAQRDKSKMQSEKDSLQNIALQAILHDHLFSEGGAILDRGSITIDELENFMKLYSSYAGLGGNGTGEELKNKIVRLHVVESNHNLVKGAEHNHQSHI